MCYPYDELQLWMKIDLQDEMPSVSLRFLHRQKDVVKKISTALSQCYDG